MPPPIFQPYRATSGNAPYVEYYGEKSFRSVFHHDRAEVTYSPYFRRMAFRGYPIADPSPENRTRLLHTIEVATIASGMARRLGLNIDLTEAIALGHDVGKPPCGYPVDEELEKFLKDQGGFQHEEFGAHLLEWASKKSTKDGIERYNSLLRIPCFRTITLQNGHSFVTTLSKEAVEGIAKHKQHDGQRYKNLKPSDESDATVEGQLVAIADNLAYLSQEIDEGLRLYPRLEKILARNAAQERLRIAGTTREKTRDELMEKAQGCVADPHFLANIFGRRTGPRLVTMINRIERFNKAKMSNHELRMVGTKACKRGKIPILEYDENLAFINEFLWTNFIVGEISKYKRVKNRIKGNREKILRTLEVLQKSFPADATEKQEFEERKAEAEYYYNLSGEKLKKRALADYVATLIDSQVNELAGGKKGA